MQHSTHSTHSSFSRQQQPPSTATQTTPTNISSHAWAHQGHAGAFALDVAKKLSITAGRGVPVSAETVTVPVPAVIVVCGDPVALPGNEAVLGM